MREIYTIKNLFANYGNNIILKNLNFCINSGALFSLIGANGSGKSTLLRVLAGLKFYSGSVKLFSHEVSKFNRKNFARSVSFVMSDKNFRPSYCFSVREIIALGRLPYRKLFSRLNDTDENLIIQAAEIMKISHLLGREITSLSDGERQLTFLAAALAQDTEILLLDEPTSALDPGKAAGVFEILRNLTNKGRTIITANHDINLSLEYSNYYIGIRNGELISLDKSENITPEILHKLYNSEFVPSEMWRALPE